MLTIPFEFELIVVGGGHAGAEAAWAAANLGVRVALVSMDPSKSGSMSCNPAIGGLAKGQMVREIDALGGLMGLAADATGIQFRVLNLSKGSAVRGPRCQSDKYRYAWEVQRLLATRSNITLFAGTCEDILVASRPGAEDRVRGITLAPVPSPATMSPGESLVPDASGRSPLSAARWVHGGAYCYQDQHTGAKVYYPDRPMELKASAVVLTTGTFMRGLMHTGEKKTIGGRIGEAPAVGISGVLTKLGFELGRLKTGTPPRVAAESLDLAGLDIQPGDTDPHPFSELTDLNHFPVIEQRPCHLTQTNQKIHDLIRANLHRAPMYNGQIQTQGPRYCPSIEDKVVRFADRTSHHVYLEPESLETNEVYCNGVSTSLPGEVQEEIIHAMPGCEHARILRYGYAVEYDMVWPHQIDATCMTKRLPGLFLAGQINGTSGYEEAAGQGLLAGLNAIRYIQGQSQVRIGRSEAYLGVMLDDLVTKTPREPYRMFTSRAEYRLLLRADNADIRLTALGRSWGLVDDRRLAVFEHRQKQIADLRALMSKTKVEGQPMMAWARRPEVDTAMLLDRLGLTAQAVDLKEARGWQSVAVTVLSEIQYAGYIERQSREVEKLERQESVALPESFDFGRVEGLSSEARHALTKFRPATLGQAGRLVGVTPAEMMLLTVALKR